MDNCPICGNALTKDEIEEMTCDNCGFKTGEREEETEDDEENNDGYNWEEE